MKKLFALLSIFLLATIAYSAPGPQLLGVQYNQTTRLVYPTNLAILKTQIQGGVDLATNHYPFTIAVIPDPQFLAGVGNESKYTNMIDWIISTESTYNTKAVIGVGDVSDNTYLGNTNQMWIARGACYPLRLTDMLTAFVGGNHDYFNMGSGAGTWTTFNLNFGLDWYDTKPTWGGSELGTSDNYYQRMTVSGIPLLFLSLEWGPTQTTITWASNIVASFPDDYVIINTHDYVHSYGFRTDGNWMPYAPNYYAKPNALDGESIWNNLVSQFPNILMVFSGHHGIGINGEYIPGVYYKSANKYGSIVHQMFSNFQMYSPVNSYVRLIHIFPDENRASVKTYSPSLGSFVSGERNNFEFTLFEGRSLPSIDSHSDTSSAISIGYETNGVTYSKWGTVFDTSTKNYNWTYGTYNDVRGNAKMGIITTNGLIIDGGPNKVISLDFSEGVGSTTFSDTINNMTYSLANASPTNVWANGIEGAGVDCSINWFVVPHATYVSGFSNLTVSGWAKMNQSSTTMGVNRTLVTKHFAGTDGEWGLSATDTSANYHFHTINASGTRVNIDVAGMTQWLDHNWHHFAAVYNGVSNILYLDGVAVGSAAQTGRLKQYNIPIYIGDYANDSAYKFTGTMDKVQILSRAKSALEIKQDFESGKKAIFGIADVQGINVNGEANTNGVTITNTFISAKWTTVTPSTTNAVINLRSGPNFIYSLSTSNYLIFSNLIAGAQGKVKVLANGTPRQLNFSSSYCYISTNSLPTVIDFTNGLWIDYSVDSGIDPTNVNIKIERF